MVTRRKFIKTSVRSGPGSYLTITGIGTGTEDQHGEDSWVSAQTDRIVSVMIFYPAIHYRPGFKRQDTRRPVSGRHTGAGQINVLEHADLNTGWWEQKR